jgi:cytochrome c6
VIADATFRSFARVQSRAKEQKRMKRTILITLALILLIAPAVLADDAASLFKTKCQACHGPNGSADTPMAKKLAIKALGSTDIQHLTDAQLTASIKGGKGKMPAFSGKITDDQIKALVDLIRSFKK